MPVVIAASEKGGAGKSTLLTIIAEALVRRGHPVALYDADPQGSLIEVSRASKLLPEASPIYPRDFERLASSSELVLLDLPSGLGDAFFAGLAIADLALIPCAASAFDVRTLVHSLAQIRRAQELRRGALRVLIVPNRINAREASSKELLATLRDLSWNTSSAFLAERSAFKRAGAAGLTALPRSSRRAAEVEANELAEEVLKALEVKKEVKIA